MRRRDFLKCASGAALLTAGCRRSGPDSGHKTEGVLNFFGYDGEEGRNVAKGFLESRGIRMQATFQGSADEALTRFRTGGRGAMDIVALNKDFLRAVLASGTEFLMPLDMSRIPNAQGLFPAFRNAPWCARDGKTYAIPLIWGDEPCIYNPKKWNGVPPKYTDFAHAKYRGELVLLNDPYTNLWLFAVSLGMPQPHRLTQKQLDRVVEAMLAVKPNVVAFGASLGDMADVIVRGDASIGIGGWAFQTVIAARKGVELVAASPAEDGTFFWCDSYAIALDAPNVENAYAFIDFMMQPQSNAALGSELGSGATIEKAPPLMDEKARRLHRYEIVRQPDGGVLNTQIVIPPQQDEGEIVGAPKWNQAWERFRLS
jgi:spermidine/putrescine-binding protein